MNQPVAAFLGWQERWEKPAIALYQLLETIPGHPAGSTVTRETLEELGYPVPTTPEREAA